jgi:hypothetical protein
VERKESPYHEDVAAAAAMQAAGGNQAETTEVLAQSAIGIVQDAISDMWVALKAEDEPQFWLDAIEAFAHAVEDAQACGAEEDVATSEGAVVVNLLVTKLAQSGDRKALAKLAEICQFLGISVPSQAEDVVLDETTPA